MERRNYFEMVGLEFDPPEKNLRKIQKAIEIWKKETEKIITIEDHSIIGGLGTAICEVLSEEYPTKVIRMGMNDKFGKSGKAEQLLKYFKLDSQAIIEKVKE